MSYPKLSQETIVSLTEFFRYVDKDNSGFITVSEIRDAFAVDINNDGVISEDEKDITSSVILQTYFKFKDSNPVAIILNQDLKNDMKLSLHELLSYNNNLS